MIRVVIKETNEIKELLINDDMEFVADMIFYNNDINENCLMILDQAEFDYWVNYIDNYKLDTQETKDKYKVCYNKISNLWELITIEDVVIFKGKKKHCEDRAKWLQGAILSYL